MSGLSKVQYCLLPASRSASSSDPHLAQANWQDAKILPPPKHWGGGLPEGPLPPMPRQFDAKGQPLTWPLRYTIAHWAALLTVSEAGQHEHEDRADVRGEDRGAHDPPSTMFEASVP